MRSGNLRHKIWIQQKSLTSDGMGSYTETWSDLLPWRAGIWPLKSRERLDAMKNELQVDHKIMMRHPRLIDITADMRIKWLDHITNENKYFNIVSIINIDKRNKSLELLALEEV